MKRFNTRKSIVKILKSLLLEGQISWWISLKINDWKQFRRQKRSRRRQIYFKLYRFTNFHLKFNFQVWDFNIVCKVVLASKKTKCSSHMKGSIKKKMLCKAKTLVVLESVKIKQSEFPNLTALKYIMIRLILILYDKNLSRNCKNLKLFSQGQRLMKLMNQTLHHTLPTVTKSFHLSASIVAVWSCKKWILTNKKSKFHQTSFLHSN